MKELEQYRKSLLRKLETSASSFRAECLAVPDPSRALGVTGWSVHQIAAHTRDVDQFVYGRRVRQTLLEDNPTFPNFNNEAYMAAHYNAGEPLEELLDGFVDNVQALTELLSPLPSESWSRLSSHATLGSGLTMQSWVEKDLAHIQEHLATVKTQNKK
jgi:hypothetical protein